MIIALGVTICVFIITLIGGGIIADKKIKEAYSTGYNKGYCRGCDDGNRHIY